MSFHWGKVEYKRCIIIYRLIFLFFCRPFHFLNKITFSFPSYIHPNDIFLLILGSPYARDGCRVTRFPSPDEFMQCSFAMNRFRPGLHSCEHLLVCREKSSAPQKALKFTLQGPFHQGVSAGTGRWGKSFVKKQTPSSPKPIMLPKPQHCAHL